MAGSAGKTVLIFFGGGGRFGNQMLRFAHLIAWAEEHSPHAELINLAAWPYMRLLEGYDRSPAGVYPPRPSRLDLVARIVTSVPEPVSRRALGYVLQAIVRRAGDRTGKRPIVRVETGSEGLDLASPAFNELCAANRGAWLAGMRIGSWPLLAKHAAAVREHLMIRRPLAAPGLVLPNAMRASHDMIVGVLSRQTDYRVYRNGRFYIPPAVLAEKLRVIRTMYPDRRVAFLLTSDEPIMTADFEGLDIRIASGSQEMGGHFVESIAALASCDLVVGPPSTFAAWAAFLGSKPYLPLLANRTPVPEHVLHDSLIGAATDPECSLAIF
ncbi:MAG: hypothetical protein SGJ11_11790 [Phycisphaerae bacterium]|nr:hypothetical protein [Phycisphaerae bacterium]